MLEKISINCLLQNDKQQNKVVFLKTKQTIKPQFGLTDGRLGKSGCADVCHVFVSMKTTKTQMMN